MLKAFAGGNVSMILRCRLQELPARPFASHRQSEHVKLGRTLPAEESPILRNGMDSATGKGQTARIGAA